MMESLTTSFLSFKESRNLWHEAASLYEQKAISKMLWELLRGSTQPKMESWYEQPLWAYTSIQKMIVHVMLSWKYRL